MKYLYLLIPVFMDAFLLLAFFRNVFGKIRDERIPYLAVGWIGKVVAVFFVERALTTRNEILTEFCIFLIGMLTTFLLAFCYDVSLRKRLIYSMEFQLLVFISRKTFPIIVWMVNRSFFDIPDTSWQEVVLSTGAKLLLLILCIAVLIPFHRETPVEYTILLFLTPMTSFGICLYIPLFEIGRTGINNFYELTMEGLLILNAVNYSLIQRTRRIYDLKSKNIQIEQQIQIQKRKYEQLSESYKQMRRALHDTKKHYFSIRELALRDGNMEVVDYLSRATEDLETTYVKYNVGNLVVDSLLTYYDSISQSNQISFIVGLHVNYQEIPLTNYDLSIVLGNILDNAVEACMPIAKNERWIKIDIETTENKKFILRCENTFVMKECKSEVSLDHGYGLQNVRRIVENNHGFLTCDQNETFVVNIWIPIPLED